MYINGKNVTLFEFHQLILQEVREDRVREFSHSQYPNLKGYVYNENCEFNKQWNEVNSLCRGLIIDIEDIKNPVILNAPFEKFFNIEQITKDPVAYLKKAYEINLINYITNKEDGSFISFWKWKGEWFCSTKGSFHAEQSTIAMEIWKNKYEDKYKEVLEGSLPLFELVGPSNKNVCRTKYSEDDLILLDIKNRLDPNFNLSYDVLEKVANMIGCPITKNYNYSEYIYNETISNDDPNYEGIVVTLFNGDRFKIKSELYKKLHKIITGAFTKQRIFDIWLINSINGNYLNCIDSNVPDEFFEELRVELDKVETEYRLFKSKAEEAYKNMKQNLTSGSSRKDLALKYKDYTWLLRYIFDSAILDNNVYFKLFEKQWINN